MVKRAIASVLSQTNGDFQLIVTDDGSDKIVPEVIRELLGNDPRCLFIMRDRYASTGSGVSRMVDGINQALKLVSGDIIHYLADDDWYASRRLEIFDKLFSKESVVVGYGRLEYTDVNEQPISVFADDKRKLGYRPYVYDPLNVLDHNQVAHRRFVLEKVPGWMSVDDYAPDGHFFRSLAKRWRFRGIDQIVAYKCMHSRNLQSIGDAEIVRE